jgi:tetratricopeptide (TPR) repeat protein
MKFFLPLGPLGGRRRFYSCGAAILFVYLISCPVATTVAQKLDPAARELRRGNALYSKRDFAGANDSYTRAIELRPDWAEAYVQRGYVRRMQGELDKAIADYDKATELDPRSTQNNSTVAEAYVNHGFIRMNGLHPEEAIRDYNKAIKVAPTWPAYVQRGQARILTEDFVGAISDQDYFLANEKFDSFARGLALADRSFAKRLLGRKEESMKDLEASLALMKGKEEVVRDHLEDLGRQLMVLRKIRAAEQKVIA